MRIKKALENRYAAYLALAIILLVAIVLFVGYRMADGFLLFGIGLVLGIVGETLKKDLLRYLPIYGYAILVLNRVYKVVIADDFLRGEEVEKMVIVAKYCSIFLLTIPIFYYNRYLRNKIKEE